MLYLSVCRFIIRLYVTHGRFSLLELHLSLELGILGHGLLKKTRDVEINNFTFSIYSLKYNIKMT